MPTRSACTVSRCVSLSVPLGKGVHHRRAGTLGHYHTGQMYKCFATTGIDHFRQALRVQSEGGCGDAHGLPDLIPQTVVYWPQDVLITISPDEEADRIVQIFACVAINDLLQAVAHRVVDIDALLAGKDN